MPLNTCSLRKHSSEGRVVLPGETRSTKIQVFNVSCITHLNFMSFKSRHKRDAWECPGYQINKENQK